MSNWYYSHKHCSVTLAKKNLAGSIQEAYYKSLLMQNKNSLYRFIHHLVYSTSVKYPVDKVEKDRLLVKKMTSIHGMVITQYILSINF